MNDPSSGGVHEGDSAVHAERERLIALAQEYRTKPITPEAPQPERTMPTPSTTERFAAYPRTGQIEQIDQGSVYANQRQQPVIASNVTFTDHHGRHVPDEAITDDTFVTINGLTTTVGVAKRANMLGPRPSQPLSSQSSGNQSGSDSGNDGGNDEGHDGVTMDAIHKALADSGAPPEVSTRHVANFVRTGELPDPAALAEQLGVPQADAEAAVENVSNAVVRDMKALAAARGIDAQEFLAFASGLGAGHAREGLYNHLRGLDADAAWGDSVNQFQRISSSVAAQERSIANAPDEYVGQIGDSGMVLGLDEATGRLWVQNTPAGTITLRDALLRGFVSFDPELNHL